MFKKIGWFIFTSLSLDAATLRDFPAPVYERIIFIIQKYLLIIKHLFTPFKFGRNFINLKGKKFYYDSKYGLAGYQGIFTRHRKLLALINKPVKVVVDIGANVGTFTLLSKTLFPKSRIIAVEPVKPIFDLLERNTKDVEAEVINAAVTDREGEVKLAYDENDSAISHIDSHGSQTARGMTLATLIKEKDIKEISLLKIDTEGFEDAVLAGAGDILSKTDYIHMEVTIDDNTRYTISSLFSYLCGDGYDFQLVGFRNFLDKGEGHVPLMDVLLANVKRVNLE